jgi:hypothetical protein
MSISESCEHKRHHGTFADREGHRESYAGEDHADHAGTFAEGEEQPLA